MPPDHTERELQRADIVADIMSDWLRGGVTGCVFAQVFAGSLSRKTGAKATKKSEVGVLWPHVVFRPLQQPLAELIEPVLIDCAEITAWQLSCFPTYVPKTRSPTSSLFSRDMGVGDGRGASGNRYREKMC